MKILYVATVRSHIGQFHMPVIKALKEAGHEVHAAFHDNSSDKKGLDLSAIDKVFEIPFVRDPYSIQNIKAYKVLKKIIDNNHYDIIHCHTPVGGVITRLAARDTRKNGTKVFYTAHGFHFYKGASKKNWMLFFPVEKYLAKYTDVLITINQEDYDLAMNQKFVANKIVMVNGVGVDLTKYHVASEHEKQLIRTELHIDPNQFVMLCAADLSKRKNQAMIFRSMAIIKDKYPKMMALMPGQPILKTEYENLCKELGISEMVQLMGYRRDIDKLLAACDCVISSSRQEGLPMNLIEAAASGKYIIATKVRGNADVVKSYGNGVLVELNDDHAMAGAIEKAILSKNLDDQSPKVEIYDEKVIVNRILALYAEKQMDI